MMVSPRLMLAACTVALALPASASAGFGFGHGGSNCAAPGYVDGCAPTCAAPCGDVCAPAYGPTCAAPCGDVCAPAYGPSCAAPVCDGYSYGCPPQECGLKRLCRKLWDLEQRKNAWLLSKVRSIGHCNDGCTTSYGCAPTCAAPCGDVCVDGCAPTCGDVCAPTCAAPCGDMCAPTCAAPVYGCGN